MKHIRLFESLWLAYDNTYVCVGNEHVTQLLGRIVNNTLEETNTVF